MSDPDRADPAGSSDEGVTDHAPEKVARLIRRVLRREAGHGEVRRLVRIAWKIALVYLRQKRSSGQLDTSHFSVGLEDLALDCIGPLFERDEEGRFVELNRYFSSLRDEVRSDREIARRFRQIMQFIRWSPALDTAQIDVRLQDGRAVLSGTVDTRWERQRAMTAAYKGGAVSVTDSLRIVGQPSM